MRLTHAITTYAHSLSVEIQHSPYIDDIRRCPSSSSQVQPSRPSRLTKFIDESRRCIRDDMATNLGARLPHVHFMLLYLQRD